MPGLAWHREALVWFESYGSVVEINEQLAGDDVEEFILVVMMMTMKITLNDAGQSV